MMMMVTGKNRDNKVSSNGISRRKWVGEGNLRRGSKTSARTRNMIFWGNQRCSAKMWKQLIPHRLSKSSIWTLHEVKFS